MYPRNLLLKIKIIERFRTQADFARIVGLSEDRLSRLIHGRVKPREAEQKVIAKKLGIEIEQIFPH